MIFDDLKTSPFTKGFIPIQTRLSTISISTVRILSNSVSMRLTGTRSFQLFRKMSSIKLKMISLSTINTMQICICWQKDMNIRATVHVSKTKRQHSMKRVTFGFVHCHERYPLLLGYHNFAIFFPGEPHQPNGYAGMEEKVRKYLFKILID